MSATFKRGQQVRYTGSLSMLRGRTGYVMRIDRKGWVVVDLCGDGFGVKCAACNLELIG